ncbi:MAG: hypothetical protein II486_00180, partial [Thermoguttaceae bacterium]|nr:hypothetical protein [Thermoguttaceae bacterium]
MNDTLNLRRVPCVNARKSRKRRLLTRFNAAGVTLTLAGAIFLTAGIGCSRQKYRTDADNEVYQLLNTVDKTSEKYWELEGFTLQEACGSRYANLYDPDAQPSPLDDCTAARLMNDVEGEKGRQKWSKNGFIQSVENENWRSTL